MKVVAIVQARLGSSRFPSKVLADLDGTPLLRVLLERLGAAETLDEVLVAVPEGPGDDPLEAAVHQWGWPVVRGHPTDVLGRYHAAAITSEADVVVRITGDCPLIDPLVVDTVVSALLDDESVDLAATGPSFPEGADCEAMRTGVLATAFQQAALPSEREHVTLFVRNRARQFNVRLLPHEPDLGDVRLTVDEPPDLHVVATLVSRLGRTPDVGIDAYAEALMADADLRSINDGIVRNEGLWRSRNRDLLDHIGLVHGRAESDRWWARANAVIPCGTQTLSKAPNQFVAGVTPAFLRSASGCVVTDVDGNSYVDYPMALGPIILGHGYPSVTEAVTRQLADGVTYTLPHPLEVEVAEQIVEAVPCAEMVRFAKNGSDVTAAAVRLARAVTGRDVVLTCGYHGWQDWYVAQTPRNAGVPAVLRDLVEPFPFNDLESLQMALDRHSDQVAAVILEVAADEPAPGFLEGVVNRAHAAGAIVIFDEIVTGFRFALGGAQEHYGVTPDLACLGKAMANGFPVSAIAGRADLMAEFERVFFSGTFGGEAVSLAAAKATIHEIKHRPVVEHLWRQGERLRDGLTALIDQSGLEIELGGHPPRSWLFFRRDGDDWPALKGLFLQETVRRGVLFGGPIFITYSHDEAVIDRTLDVCASAFDVLAGAVRADDVDARLDGPPPAVVFRAARS